MNPQISIIIPTYNGGENIERAVESVLKQTFQNFEIIIIDDFSKDNTVEIIEELKKEEPRIKLVILDRNSGSPAKPKNEGFKIARGRYIAYLDQDDEWLPNKLEEQIRFFKDSNNDKLGIVSCGAILMNIHENIFSYFIPVQNKNIFPEILLRNPIYSNSSVLIKREVIEKVGDRDEYMKYSEDLEMWIRVAGRGYDFGYIFKPLFKYYFHSNNVSSVIDIIHKAKDMEYTFKKHKDLYKKHNYVHVGLFRLGIMYLLGNSFKKGRINLIESIKTNRLFIPAYVGYILSMFGFLGLRIINLLIFLYRIIKGRKYLLFSPK
jgi:glycosyltransferase involved in cell wall biosynthesis